MKTSEEVIRERQLLAAALSKLNRVQLNQCFDPIDPTSRPTKPQQEVMNDFGKIRHQYITAGNQSGKSATAARITAWLFNEEFPNWKRPDKWGDEPLLLIVMGRTTKQIEETLWKKISQFLEVDSYRVQSVGGVIQKITHKKNGNTIIFLSHHSENEAREKVQSFVSHFVWLDEMPGNVMLIEELHRRVQAKEGYFLCTFTPKVANSEIKRLVDGAELPHSKKYKFAMFDNPIYSEQQKNEIIASLATYPEAYRNCILYGDWLNPDNNVYYFDYPSMVRKIPETYSLGWRHVEASDPALQSAFGFTLWAEDPKDGKWYCVRSEYIKGIYVPDKVLEHVLKITSGYNLVRRICDPHESWYVNLASSKGIHYTLPYKKNERKGELIKNFQTALGQEIFLTPPAVELIDEIQRCQWSEKTEGKIASASDYHTIDSAQYFVDCKPKYDPLAAPLDWPTMLRIGNDKRKLEESKRKMQTGRKYSSLRKRW